MDRPTGLRQALAEAEASGALPLTSTCNVACVFCSNHGNPPGVEVYRVPPRSIGELERALRRMRGRRGIVIGESASRVSEGEPLTHPRFHEILELIRRLHPTAPIKLTTNGTLLEAATARALAAAAPVEVTISINTADPDAHCRLHGPAPDPRPALGHLRAAGVPFDASIVAVPAVTGTDDLVRTLGVLSEHGCRSCRVFVPGYTRLTPAEVVALLPTYAQVTELVERARASVDLPLTIEPPAIIDLEARITGILAGSPAERAGLVPGDVIDRVDGRVPFSRVDAFRLTRRALRDRAQVRLDMRGRGEVTLRGTDRPGLVLDRDVDPADIQLILAEASARRARRTIAVTGVLGRVPLRLGLDRAAARGGGGGEVLVWEVPSVTFAGSIGAAGLLTIADVAAAAGGGPPGAGHRRGDGAPLSAGDLVLLPPAAFNRTGHDLSGCHFSELAGAFPPGVGIAVPGRSEPLQADPTARRA